MALEAPHVAAVEAAKDFREGRDSPSRPSFSLDSFYPSPFRPFGRGPLGSLERLFLLFLRA